MVIYLLSSGVAVVVVELGTGGQLAELLCGWLGICRIAPRLRLGIDKASGGKLRVSCEALDSANLLIELWNVHRTGCDLLSGPIY